MQDTYWFVTYLGYESKQKLPRELIVSFRKFNSDKSKMADVYVNYPVLIPTFNIYFMDELQKILERVKEINSIEDVIVYLPPKQEKNLGVIRDKYQIKAEINDQRYVNFSVINVILPNNPSIIDRLPSTKINGFQKGSYTRITRRPLNILNRKVILDEKLNDVFSKKDEIRDLETEIIYLINKSPEEDKPHIIRKQLFELSQDYKGQFRLEDILDFAKNKRFTYLHSYLSKNNPEFLLNLQKRIIDNVNVIEELIKKIDKLNYLIADKDKLIYKMHLQYSPLNKTESNPLGVRGMEFKEHLFDELKQESKVYFDLEKPLWKKKHEKVLLDRREKLLKLKKSPDFEFQEKQNRIDKLIKEIEEKLTVDVNGIKIPLYEEKYDAKITNLTSLIEKQNSLLRQYHKINYNPDVKSSIADYEIFNHENERQLINEVFHQFRKNNPFSLRNHNIPYDLIQSREAFLHNKLGKKFDLSTESLNPIRDAVREIYQRVLSPGQEVFDTYRLMFNFFPFLKSRFGSSHKLEDSARFIRNLRKLPGDFKKIATHEQLRDLMIEAMHGNKQAELDLDKYTIADVEEPLRDIAEYPVFIDTILNIKKLMPHVPLTQIMFSPTIMEELHKTIHFQRYHNERYFGYEEKIREDEKEIFDKRYGALKTKMLEKNNINILHLDSDNVTQAYIPVELWLKRFLFNVFLPWQDYFNKLNGDPLERFAMLQYPKYFLKDPLIDFYFYIRERNIYYNNLKRINVNQNDAKNLFSKLEMIIFDSNNGLLLKSYDGTFESLKNIYRSIYVKLPKNIRNSVRLKPVHLYMDETNSQLNLGVNLFDQDNLDLIKVRNMPEEIKKSLKNDVAVLFKRFNSTFLTLQKTSKSLESLIDDNVSRSLGITKDNLPYLLNQRRRAIRRMKKFRLFYNYNPENFDFFFGEAFSNLAMELKQNNILVLDLQGDYLFVKGDLPENSMLIPIRNIPNYTKIEPKFKEDNESNLFEMPQDNPA